MSTRGNPSVLAFEKKLVPSDGRMYATVWNKRDNNAEAKPLHLQEKSVRGTISNRLKSEKEAEKIDAKVEAPNLQTVDSCALAPEQDTLRLRFTLKVLGGIENPSACNDPEWLKKYQAIVEKYKEANKFTELARRYAYNIANARFLWRNRVGAEHIETHVSCNEKQLGKFSSLDYPLRDFSKANSSEIENLAQAIAEALYDEQKFAVLEITCYAKVGRAQDVYPSEELVLDKKTGKEEKKSKVLYHIDEIAAMHSQKIGNAIRTIDTWYPDSEHGVGAIAVEPYGAVTNLGKAFRVPTNKKDFYSLFDGWVVKDKEPSIEDQHYVMAVLVRGGVFGESGKDKKNSKE